MEFNCILTSHYHLETRETFTLLPGVSPGTSSSHEEQSKDVHDWQNNR